MYSTPLKGTNTKKIKLSWFDYYFSHCWMTGWQSIGDAFRIWADLMGSNYKKYALPRTAEDPEEECISWFWVSLGEDNVYPKEFIEYLMRLCEDVKTGRVETYPLEDVMAELKELTEGIEDDE